MVSFRNKLPVRRNITRAVSRYQDHKEDLKTDFSNRCGYCDCSDHFRMTYYEIDHFVPKEYLKTMKETDYCNLVYACRSCNNSKRKKWPTKDEKTHNKNEEGFVDPCNEEYDKHFNRNDKGEIYPVSALGEWMYKELKLHKPQHAIIWKLEQLKKLIEEYKNSDVANLSISDELKMKIINIFCDYDNLLDELRAVND